MDGPSSISDAIRIDELGIRTAWYGDVQLKTAYQPIYRNVDGILVPEAIEALLRPFRDGQPILPRAFFQEVRPEDRVHVEVLSRTLHLDNYPNLGEPGVALYFHYDPRVNGAPDEAIDQLNWMAARLDGSELDIGLLVCEITEADFLERDAFLRLATEVRRLGMRIALDDFGSGHSTLERVQMIEPDIIKFDGAFFRRVAEAPEARILLPNLVSGFQRGGAEVLIEGIETTDQLSAAVDTGAELLQGYLLGRPDLAGVWFDTVPRPLKRYTEPDQQVVDLFPTRRSTHQSG